MRAVEDDDGWQETSLETRIVVDPVAVRSGDRTFVTAISNGYGPVLATWPARAMSSKPLLAARPPLVGVPALMAHDGTVDMFARGIDGQLRRLTPRSFDNSWSYTTLGGSILQFPSAARFDDGSERVYVRTLDGLREVARSAPDAAWEWSSLDDRPIWAGSPTIDDSATPVVTARDQSGALHRFHVNSDGWQMRSLHTRISDSPVSVGESVFGFDAQGRLIRTVGPKVEILGKP